MMHPALSNALRELRRIHDMTQEDLADATGVTPNFISMVEREDRLLSNESAPMFANALGVSSSEFNLLATNDMGGKVGKLLTSIKKLILESVKVEVKNGS